MPVAAAAADLVQRELRSRNFLVPGLVAIIMTLIGALLTAMVMAREWERGTMEALMVTPVTMREILLGKLIPYFVLGMGGMALSVAMAIWLFEVPLRGSLWVLLRCLGAVPARRPGHGAAHFHVARSQFVAGQIAIITTFLPAFLLSGFIFDIGSMPAVVQVHHPPDRRALFRRHPAVAVSGRRCLGRDPAQYAGPGDDGLDLPRPGARVAASVWSRSNVAAHPRPDDQGVPGPTQGQEQPLGAYRAAADPAVVFGYAATFDLNHVPFAVYNEDHG